MQVIDVRIEDTSIGSSYQFSEPSGWKCWTTPPRVGDFILDANEFKYVVLEVIWYEPYQVTVKVSRRQ